MTTDQTIDGVPRGVLSDAFDELPDWNTPAATKLRTLLDAPVNPLSEIEVLRAAVKELEAMRDARVDAKLAQPQGEPVAPFYICIEDFNRLVRDDTAIASVRVSREKRGPFTVPLYAEQPAPVAVTLSQVLTAYDYAEAHQHKYLRGTTNWCAAMAYKLNSCLDEVTRLNAKS